MAGMGKCSIGYIGCIGCIGSFLSPFSMSEAGQSFRLRASGGAAQAMADKLLAVRWCDCSLSTLSKLA